MADTLKQRTEARRKRLVTHVAVDFQDADQWDLDCLLSVKEHISAPKHQEDARILRLIKERGKKSIG